MEQRKWRWTDAHYCSLPSQTTIYGCTKIQNNDNTTNKLLVASLVGRFFTIEYQRIFDKLTPSTKEIQFTYIPGDSEIVSVDATNKCSHGNGLTIGITFWKLEENESKQFLHTYTAAQPGEEFNLESVAQGCQSLELSFMPYHLTHTELVKGDLSETVFLLSGSDNKIHVYREVNNQHSLKEADGEDDFPELNGLPSVVMWLDIHYYNNNSRRITVTGHQDGLLKVSIVDVEQLEVLNTYTVEFDNPITYAVTFSLSDKWKKPEFLATDQDPSSQYESSIPELNILVLSALVPATVYRDVLRHGLKDPVFLPDSNKFDAILTGCVIDIDFDGQNEILIGTYGQEVLAYKLMSSRPPRIRKCSSVPNKDLDYNIPISESKARHLSGDSDLSTTPKFDHVSRRVKSQENLSSSVGSDAEYVPLSSSKDTVISNHHLMGPMREETSSSHEYLDEETCRLLWQRSFACPVMGINRLDIMGDGMDDLVIVTLKGLHTLQPDLNEVASVVIERLKILADVQEANDRMLTKGENNDHQDVKGDDQNVKNDYNKAENCDLIETV